MKRILIILGVLVTLSFFITFLGCNILNPAEEASVTKHTSFMGADLGMSKSEVQSVFGTGTYTYTSGTIEYYTYSDDKVVGFINATAEYIATNGTGYSIENITVGNTLTYVENKLGDPNETTSSTYYYYYWYPDRNLQFTLNKSTDKVYLIAIYNPSKVTPASVSSLISILKKLP